jgi:hypothetical protein
MYIYDYMYMYYMYVYRVEHKSLTTLCKSQSIKNRWITTICDLIRTRGKSLGGGKGLCPTLYIYIYIYMGYSRGELGNT